MGRYSNAMSSEATFLRARVVSSFGRARFLSEMDLLVSMVGSWSFEGEVGVDEDDELKEVSMKLGGRWNGR